VILNQSKSACAGRAVAPRIAKSPTFAPTHFPCRATNGSPISAKCAPSVDHANRQRAPSSMLTRSSAPSLAIGARATTSSAAPESAWIARAITTSTPPSARRTAT
jgi:hypothetical protein